MLPPTRFPLSIGVGKAGWRCALRGVAGPRWGGQPKAGRRSLFAVPFGHSPGWNKLHSRAPTRPCGLTPRRSRASRPYKCSCQVRSSTPLFRRREDGGATLRLGRIAGLGGAVAPGDTAHSDVPSELAEYPPSPPQGVAMVAADCAHRGSTF